MRRRSQTASIGVGVVLAACGVAPGCISLETPATGQCGNGILEPSNGEFCDGGENCGEPGAANACELLCSGPESPCPADFNCGSDDVCRMGLGAFDDATSPSNVFIDHIAAVDFDQDRRDELVLSALQVPSQPFERSTLLVTTSVLSFDAGLTSPKESEALEVGSAARFADVDGDGNPEFLAAGLVADPAIKEDGTVSLLRTSDASLQLFRWHDAEATLVPAPFVGDTKQRAGIRTWPLENYANYDADALFFPPDEGTDAAFGPAPELLPHSSVSGRLTHDPYLHDSETGWLSPCPYLYAEVEPEPLRTNVYRFDYELSGPIVDTGFFCSPVAFASVSVDVPSATTQEAEVLVASIDDNGGADLIVSLPDDDETLILTAFGKPGGVFHSSANTDNAVAGDGSFGPPVLEIDTAGSEEGKGPVEVVAVSDFSGNGALDLLVMATFHVGDSVKVMIGVIRDAELTASSTVTRRHCPGTTDCFSMNYIRPDTTQIVTAEADGDEAAELFMLAGGEVHEYALVGPTLAYRRGFAIAQPVARIEVVDLDGNGFDDVVAVTASTSLSKPDGAVLVLWGGIGAIAFERFAEDLPLVGGLAGSLEYDIVSTRTVAVDVALGPGEMDTGTLTFEASDTRELRARSLPIPAGRAFEVGTFSPSGVPEALVIGNAEDLETDVEEAEAIATVAISGGLTLSVAETATPGQLPAHWGDWASTIALDLDGDRVDELVILGPDPEEFQRLRDAGWYPLDFTRYRVSTFERTQTGWNERGSVATEVAFRGAYPRRLARSFDESRHLDRSRNTHLGLIEIDDDPEPEVLAIVDGAAWVLDGEGGVLNAPTPINIERDVHAGVALDPVNGLPAVALVSSTAQAAEVLVGTLDEALAFVEIGRLSVDSKVHWATAGDFDGDGVLDLALATDDGPRIYRQRPATPSQVLTTQRR